MEIDRIVEALHQDPPRKNFIDNFFSEDFPYYP